MTLGHIIRLAQKEELRSEMEVFLSFLLSMSRGDLLAHPEVEIPVEQLAELQKAWVQIQDGMPVAYLIHSKEFYGLDFYVDERVLVPRGETERLVDYILKLLPEGGRVLEIGTGSGAISVALKHERPDLNVTATDVSEAALEVARKNCSQLAVDVSLIHSDLLESVPSEPFDCLVANLPYIGEETHHFISENVEKHEPHVALFGGKDGLRLYANLFDQIKTQDRDFKWILGEIGFTQGSGIEHLCKEFFPERGFELKQDYQGLDRHFISVTLPPDER